MLDTTQLKEYAQLTQATYAYFPVWDRAAFPALDSLQLSTQIQLESGGETKGANFTEEEAKLFVARYELLNQSDNSDPTGFSAALFRDKDTGRLIKLKGSASINFPRI